MALKLPEQLRQLVLDAIALMATKMALPAGFVGRVEKSLADGEAKEMFDELAENVKKEREEYQKQIDEYRGQAEQYRGQAEQYRGQIQQYRGQAEQYQRENEELRRQLSALTK
jgi:uncharacterized coiled-coil DUF342 family protein